MLRSFLSRPVRTYNFVQRLLAGGFLGVCALGIPALLLVAISVFGGRYQISSGVEDDMWVLAALYPVGAAVAGAVGFAFGPWVRRAWQASLLGSTAMFPMFALISISSEPHGPRPYHVQWGLAAVLGVLVGGVAGLLIFRRIGSRD